MVKQGRIQFRANLDDKEWFENYAEARGGMSRVLNDFIRALRRSEAEITRPPSNRKVFVHQVERPRG